MNAKMKSCFEPHVMMHSLFGLGLGITLTVLFPALSVLWIGLALMAAAFVLDSMRKK